MANRRGAFGLGREGSGLQIRVVARRTTARDTESLL